MIDSRADCDDDEAAAEERIVLRVMGGLVALALVALVVWRVMR